MNARRPDGNMDQGGHKKRGGKDRCAGNTLVIQFFSPMVVPAAANAIPEIRTGPDKTPSDICMIIAYVLHFARLEHSFPNYVESRFWAKSKFLKSHHRSWIAAYTDGGTPNNFNTISCNRVTPFVTVWIILSCFSTMLRWTFLKK